MAALNGTITVSKREYRPCFVEGKKALFHMWAEKWHRVMAIVEYEDGTVETVLPENVRFVSGKHKDYCWVEEQA